MSVNKVILIGNLGGDPEVRFMPNGNAVANMTVATSERWTDKQSGEKREKTEWHRVCIYGKLAEIAGQYLRKGSKVYIEGQNETREWEKDGVKRYTTEVVVKMNGQMQMLDGKSDVQQLAPQQQRQAQAPRQQQSQQSVPVDYNEFDSEIPFVDPYRGRLAILV